MQITHRNAWRGTRRLGIIGLLLLCGVLSFSSWQNAQATGSQFAHATTATATLKPVADAHVKAAYPRANFGTAPELRVDGSPAKRAYLRFDVAGLTSEVSKATLRLYATSNLSTAIKVLRVADNSWGESTITYNNAPAIGTPIATVGAATAGAWLSVDVTSYVTGNGTYSFVLTNANSTALGVASREATNKPKLVIQTGSGTLPPRTSTPVAPTPTKAPATATKAPATPTKVLATPTKVPATSTPVSGTDPVVLVTGDSRPGCTSAAANVVALLDTLPSSWPLLFTGDSTTDGTASQFSDCFDPTWRGHKAQIRPIPGNHEYHTSGASGYFNYFGSQAGPAGKGYYSLNVGAWHIVALNSEIDVSAASTQVAWLKNDLAANPKACTIAYWHEPRWSSGQHGNNTFVSALWQTLYDNNAELVFNGHDHLYERFAPQNPLGALDNARGLREFVVGTAGVELYSWGTIRANSQVRNNSTWGVLKLTLHANSYDWKFLPIAGQSFTDAGTTACH